METMPEHPEEVPAEPVPDEDYLTPEKADEDDTVDDKENDTTEETETTEK